MKILRTLTVPRAIDEVFAYLADFTRTEEWDPGTVTTTRMSGDGGVGTQYHNTSRFMGRETTLVYTVQEVVAPNRLVLRGENSSVVALDTMTLNEMGPHTTEITYRADFTFKGLTRLVAPFTALAFRRLGNDAERQLREVLS